MSLPIRFNTDAINSAGGITLIQLSTNFDFCKTGVAAFCYNFTDCLRAHTHYGCKSVRDFFGVFYNPGLDFNGLNSVAGGKDSAATVKNHAAMGLLQHLLLSLLDGQGRIMAALQTL